ncbi:HAMP domain-containing methyl-accepting chemotaxis protein [Stappia indica]|uniref:HAMP domain-containing methyl-accepting chemotaxis protein n=1 Tax=Stappia indica TaxID=538381 RepID=UPI001CD365DB|nr:methyl-accepting chemotaxis protein [Stappia indica]MCA1298690.1 methyl-accepting chemotaxis protein [Stappia indica]
MLNHIKISKKIFGGFGTILLLLLVISTVSSLNLSSGSDNFARYRAIAIQTNLAGEVQSNLLEARLAVKNFIQRSSQEDVATVENRIQRTRELGRELNEGLAGSEIGKIIANAGEEITAYTDGFAQVVRLQAERDGLIADVLNSAGVEIERKLTEIMRSAYDDRDVGAAYRAANVQRSLLLMRLYMAKFLVTSSDADFDRVVQEGTAMAELHKSLVIELQDPTRRALAKEVGSLREAYIAGATRIHDATIERNRITAQALDVYGPKIAQEMEQLKLAIKAEQESLGPQATAAMSQAVVLTVTVALIAIALGLWAAWFIGRGIANPIRAITEAMKTLAAGDKTTEIPGQDHRDEIGDMAAAVNIFKENMIKADTLSAREAEEARARQARAQRIEQLTQNFDASISELLNAVASASTEMEGTASSMSTIANDTNDRATTVASAAEEASANVQTVASATDELSSSIQEISRQVAQSSSIAGRAVEQADKTNGQVQGLALAAQRIGEVVSLISAIAEQTNLLALNATIEAARAGEAGKGFAVVAAEVKELANQTAKATEDISQQIGSIQTETDEAVAAIQVIGRTITEINEIAAGIAAAVEEQSAATGEIARNVEQASIGTQEVSSNIIEVTHGATETGAAATQVTGVAADLSSKAERLKAEVEQFLADVRAA